MLKRFLDSPWPYFSLAAILVVLAVFSQIQWAPPEPPEQSIEELTSLRDRDDLNVVFIVIDTLRSDRLEAYGYERATSPHIAALANRGIVFERVESQSSWTKASMASMWTGMYPERTGVQRFMHGVPEEALMPAEVFKENGYRTAGVWRNGWTANNFGFSQGFDMYVRPSRNRPVKDIRRNNPSANRLMGTDLDATMSAMEFILGNPEDRFFLYVHYMDVHQYLYADSSPDFGTDFSDIYDSSIHWTDRNIGLLIAMLEEERLLDRTLIVLASDHGEAFFEHGIEGHARNLYREVQQVPLIIVPPFKLAERVEVPERVANVDIWPTLFDMIGFDPLPEAEGKSLLPLILDSAGVSQPEAEALRSRTIFSQLDRSWGWTHKDSRPLIAAVKDDYRYVEGVGERERGELFDRNDDAAERRNVVDDRTEIRDEFHSEIDSFLAIPRPAWNPDEVELDEMKKNQLRALGYVIPASERRKAEREEAAAADEEPETGEGAASE